MTIENNVDFTGSEKKTANCCIVPDNQKNCSDLANQPQMLHRYPLTPCMGLLHLKYRKVNNCNLSCENDLDVGADKIRPTCVDKTPVVNDYSAKELLKRYPILPYESLLEKEKNKCQDVFKPRRQSLLNRMMPTVRQPIKARHSLHNAKNNNICESGDFVKITGEKNQPIVIRNNSCHEEAKIWNQAKNRLLESKIAQNIPVTSTEYQYSTCKRTKICTVPGMKRRSSIEDAALSRSNEQYLKYDRPLQTTVKRSCTDEFCKVQRTNYENRYIYQSSDAVKNTTICTCGIQSSGSLLITTSSIPSSPSISTSSVPSAKRQSLPLKSRRWNKVASKQFSRRFSTGSVSSVQSSTEYLNSENDSVHAQNPLLKTALQQSSSIFRGIRKSAQQTISNICKVMKYSNPNISLTSNSSYHNVDHSNQPFISKSNSFKRHTEHLPHSDSLRNTSFTTEYSYELNKISVEKNGEMIVSDDSCQCVPTVRYVILSRREFDESFGLFVIKSEQGYRITRLSEKLKQNNQLHIGDEIIQINGIHCKQLNIYNLQKLFHNNQSIILTFIDSSNDMSN
ncbi:unnamed protein product [Schistosoma rodhaini]|uniref:PDZ domain-containing protein n=1 Tax=Schistosoma mansoni TaxID=6183 RepID=A0A3Q0KMU5_SCHMA|nr:unnamed protein product [Schistosoma rodhaini]